MQNKQSSHIEPHKDALRILVVDDNEADYAYVRELFSEIPGTTYRVDCAPTFEQALQMLQHEGYDACLVDHRLGQHTGIELLCAARSARIFRPFIMLTGLADEFVDRRAMGEGAADFLVKGELTPMLLERSVRYAIERQRLMTDMDDAARHDALTGLANRREFQEFLEGAIARARRSGQTLGLLFIDLDHFKEVNDHYGHDAGDQLLVWVAKLLSGCVRRGDLVARLGGDEFAIVLDNIDSPDRAAQVADKILRTFDTAPHSIGAATAGIGTSIGIAVHPDAGDDTESLIKAADTAMYEAKALGRNNYQCFEQRLQTRALRRSDLHRSLANAIPGHALDIHYQAQLILPEGRLRGLEALVRWEHQGTFVSPTEFIPIAEESGQISALGNWVLRSACFQLREWELRGLVPPGIRLSVNVSAQQVSGGDLLRDVETILADAGLAAGRLELEITETAKFRDIDAAASELHGIRELGVHLALDDFGTGHASFEYLQKLPVQTIKIDSSFVRECLHNHECAVVVKGTIGIARALGLELIAEGIESQAQLDFLQKNGCNVAQGFLFHRPSPADDVTIALQRERWLVESDHRRPTQRILLPQTRLRSN